MSREAIKNYRLSPTELNALVRKLASILNTQLSPIEYQTPSSVSVNGKNFIILPMCKDAETEANESHLNFIGDVIKHYSQDLKGEDCTLLIPMRMCRGYLKAPTFITYLKRKHAVLVEVNLKDMHAEIHDSQGRFRKIFYPDKLAEIGENLGLRYDPTMDYHAHGMQENLLMSDVVSCGYYVFAYIAHILSTGNSSGCEKIALDIMQNYLNKNEFLKAHGVEVSGLEDFDDEEDEDLLEFEINSDQEKKMLTFEIDTENEVHVETATHKENNSQDSGLTTYGLFADISHTNEIEKVADEKSEMEFKV